MFYLVVVYDVEVVVIFYEIDCVCFLGCGNILQVLQVLIIDIDFFGIDGLVLDLIVVICVCVVFEFEQIVQLDMVYGIGVDCFGCEVLVDKYCDCCLVDCVFDLVWMYSQVVCWQINVSQVEVFLYECLVGYVLYVNVLLCVGIGVFQQNQ